LCGTGFTVVLSDRGHERPWWDVLLARLHHG
jgi:hypothetical protein